MKKFAEHRFEKSIYIVPSWEQMGEAVFLLSKKILQSGKIYDWIISIAKGGWTWSRTLADYLDMDNLASVKAKLYEDIGKTKLFSLEQELPAAVDIKGKRILLFDDVSDSGKTFVAVKDYLIKRGSLSIDTASLFYKPHSVLKPDYFVHQTSAWIVFPHEIREFITLSKKQWAKAGLNKQEIIARLIKLGIDKNQVKFFLNNAKITMG